MVRAKFKVEEIRLTEGRRNLHRPDGTPDKDERGYIKTEPCEMTTVVMYPVCDTGNAKSDNSKFWQATPNGKIELGTINPEAAAHFRVGMELYVDFTPVG